MRGQRHPPTASYPRERPIVHEAGWASRSVWTGAEILSPTGIRSPDRPRRRQSRLRYLALRKLVKHTYFFRHLLAYKKHAVGFDDVYVGKV